MYVIGFPLHRAFPSSTSRFFALSVTLLFASVSFAALQERAVYVPGFKFAGWMTTITCVTYAICAFVERLCGREFHRRGEMREYVKLSLMVMGGMFLTNWSLRFLSYPLRVVFKSSKVLPVMLMSVVYQGKRYGVVQYLGVILLTLGLVVFTLGDAKGRASFDVRGIVLVCAGSLLEAFAANFEEKLFFRHLGASPAEVILYSSLTGAAMSLLMGMASGDLFPALRHSANHPEVVFYMSAAACMGYIAANLAMTIISYYGATVAELVKSCRKVLTICISFLIYGKPWTLCHIAGGLLFTSSVAVERFAAGGQSRRFAGLLFGSALGLSAWVISGSGPSAYSVVIDAGSQGTRLHVFRFDAWTLKLQPVGSNAQVFLEAAPLSSFAWNVSLVSTMLDPLLQTAAKVVPVAQRAVTPVTLRATSGLRLLRGVEADALLTEVRRLIEPYGFEDGGAEIMDGGDEAEYIWLAANYLTGTFQPGMYALKNPCAVVDLGGGAMQMVYLVSDEDALAAQGTPMAKHIRRLILPFDRGNAHLYQHSYLGFGLQRARAKSIVATGHGAAHPCLPAEANISFRDVYAQKVFHVLGDSDPDECMTLAKRVLHAEQPCGAEVADQGTCAVDGVWAGPGLSKQRLMLASYFYTRMVDTRNIPLGIGSQKMTAGSFSKTAKHVCNVGGTGAETIEAMFPSLSQEDAAWLCFDMSYEAALLTHGFRVPADMELTVASELGASFGSEIHQYKVSWALGVAIREVSKVH